MRAPTESSSATIGSPPAVAISRRRPTFSACISEKEPPSTVKSCANTAMRRPSTSRSRSRPRRPRTAADRDRTRNGGGRCTARFPETCRGRADARSARVPSVSRGHAARRSAPGRRPGALPALRGDLVAHTPAKGVKAGGVGPRSGADDAKSNGLGVPSTTASAGNPCALPAPGHPDSPRTSSETPAAANGRRESNSPGQATTRRRSSWSESNCCWSR